MGSTTDPRQSFRSSLHSFHIGTNSSSPAEAVPLIKQIKLKLQKGKTRNVTSSEFVIRSFWHSPHMIADYLSELINNLFCCDATSREVMDPILQFLQARIATPINQNHFKWWYYRGINGPQWFNRWNAGTFLQIWADNPDIWIHPMNQVKSIRHSVIVR